MFAVYIVHSDVFLVFLQIFKKYSGSLVVERWTVKKVGCSFRYVFYLMYVVRQSLVVYLFAKFSGKYVTYKKD